MSEQLKSSEGLEVLNKIHAILLENEYLKNANQELVARNVDLSQTIAELNISIAVLQTAQEAKAGQTSAAAKIDSLAYTCARKHDLIPLIDTPSPHARSKTPIEVVASTQATPDTSSPEPVPFFYGSGKGRKALMKIAKLGNSHSFMIVPRIGYTWKEAHIEGSYFKPAQMVSKDRKITLNVNKKFRKTLELILQNHAGGWCYLGSFKATAPTILSRDEFFALSAPAQESILTQTAGKAARRRHDIRSMYESGELAVVQIDVKRVAFNKDSHQRLLDAAETLQESEQGLGQDDAGESQDSD